MKRFSINKGSGRFPFSRHLPNSVTPHSELYWGVRPCDQIQGVFLHWASPKKLKYGKPKLGESRLT